ncbi:MAG: hypothetical protein RIF39_06340 [Cyclobacteriaceae bacterium]
MTTTIRLNRNETFASSIAIDSWTQRINHKAMGSVISFPAPKALTQTNIKPHRKKSRFLVVELNPRFKVNGTNNKQSDIPSANRKTWYLPVEMKVNEYMNPARKTTQVNLRFNSCFAS